ncbi:YeeE/YedE family protein [Celerinatantimonas yamalensis]|uniref:YeeE/YedE family protein n=1 Tax=Celerinatantimonas yamalensis TaxID=559956 RepID=A0ABW9G4F8_9GAMM
MHYAWWMALIGGACIGLASLLLLVVNGKIAGISGIVSALLSGGSQPKLWQSAFVVGLLMAPWIVAPLGVYLPSFSQINPYLALIAGLLVGFGTRLGNGCTSGHGICGVGRLSPRSLVATVTFMVVAMITASLLH